jgi:NH3-dependent NAD+ synthetase
MAQVRIVVLTWPKLGALVCGGTNRALPGYFLAVLRGRGGSIVSCIKPIVGNERNQSPEIFYTKAPSAGLWDGQTDEKEMGFSYAEADKVLKGEIEGVDKAVVEKVQKMVQANKFKLEVPYMFG